MKVFLILWVVNTGMVVVPEPFPSQEACVAAGKNTRFGIGWDCVVLP